MPSGAATWMQMVTTARCEAAGPWGMQGMIEDIMATQASQTLEGFLLFCKERCMVGRLKLVRACGILQWLLCYCRT